MTTAAVVATATLLLVLTAPRQARRPRPVARARPGPARRWADRLDDRVAEGRRLLIPSSPDLDLAPALDELARSLRSGSSLGEALVEAGSPGRGAGRSPVFETVARDVDHGTSVVDALDRWRSSATDDAVDLAATALVVGLESGGSRSQAVESVAATLRERAEIDRESRALATQARASAAVIAVAPVGFTVLIAGVDPATSGFLVGSRIGWACIVGGLALDLVGLWWILRILDRPGALPVRHPRSRTMRRLRLTSAVAVGLAVVLAAGPLGGAVAAAVVFGRWRRRRTRAERWRSDALVDELPDVIDLIGLALGAGANVAQSVAAATRHRSPRRPRGLADALSAAVDRAAVGSPLADALQDVPIEAGPACRPLVDALVAAERHGAPLLPSIAVLARDARLERRRRTEERARTVSVRLLFPLVACILPAFALLTVVPLLAGSVGALTG